MPMSTCPACGKPVSALAPLCPGCGHPIKPLRPCRQGWLIGCGCLLSAFFSILLAIIIGLLIWIGVSLQPLGDDETAPDPTVTLDDSRRERCQDNMEEIALIKEEWATAHDAKKGAIIPEADVKTIFAETATKFICPKDDDRSFKTSYDIGSIGTNPKCKCDDEHNQMDEESK